MLESIKNTLKNYRLKKNFTSFTIKGVEDYHAIATLLYPQGNWIKKQDNLYTMYEKTRDYSFLKDTPIYNATIVNPSGIYASADILTRNYNPYQDSETTFDIIETYATNTPKDDIIKDIAFKKFVFETNDFKIKRCIILYPQEFKIGQHVNIKDFFIKEDITDEILPLYKKFKKIPYQDITPIPHPNNTLKLKNNTVYIDYSYRKFRPNENKENYDYRARPFQSKCRAQIGQDKKIHYFCYSHKNNTPQLAQIEFLTQITQNIDIVYMRNSEFEKAHHREIAKMFPQKSALLYELNKKIREWENYSPLPYKLEQIANIFL